MKMLKEKDIIKRIYPEAAKKQYLGTKKYHSIFADARDVRNSVNLMVLRSNILNYHKVFKSGCGLAHRDVWKSNQRLYEISKVIL